MRELTHLLEIFAVDDHAAVDAELARPKKAEILALTEMIASRVRRLLGRRGLLGDAIGDGSDEPASAVDACQAASLRNVVVFGLRAGRPLRKVMLPPPPSSSLPTTHESRGVAGFDLDVGAVIRASDRPRLERLWRYALRPLLATDRLEELADARLRPAIVVPAHFAGTSSARAPASKSAGPIARASWAWGKVP